MPGGHMPLEIAPRAATIALLAAACASPHLARAGMPGYQIQAGVVESDNIQRLPSGGSDETIGALELGFNWLDTRPWLDADITADVSHLHYFQHTYSDEFIGNLIGNIRFTLAPQLLSWEVSDNFGQAPLNPLAPITPDNRQNINYFNTGPTLSLPFGQTTQLAVTGEYGRADYQQSALDSTRLTGAVELLHALSPVSHISVTARDEHVQFADDQLNPDYQMQEAFARWETKGSRTELGIDLGYSRAQISGTHDGTPLVRLDLSRKLSASSTLGLALGHAYSDGIDAFRLVQTLGGATLYTLPVFVAGPPFVDSFATLAWNFKRARTTLELSASYLQDRYKTDSTLDNNRALLDGTAARQITPTLRLALTEHLVRWEFNNGFNVTGGNATESDTGLQMTWHVGRHFSVMAAYYLSKGNSNVPDFNYTENRLWLAVGYGRAAEAPPGPAPVRLPVMP